jgi:dipeptidyl aminopeptidase/acylaminoacyl peptidase
MTKIFFVLILLVSCACSTNLPSSIIPRRVLFSDYEKWHPRISPDGKQLAYMAQEDGHTQIWVRHLDKKDDRKLKTWDLAKQEGLNHFFWASDSRHLIFRNDLKGDENFHLYQIDIKTSEVLDLTPFEGAQARLEANEALHPDQLVFSANVQSRETHDLYRIDLKTNSIYLMQKNPGSIIQWLIDHDLKIRGGIARIAGLSGRQLVLYDPLLKTFNIAKNWPPEANIHELCCFSSNNKQIWFTSDYNSNTSRLFEYDIEKATYKVVAEDPDFDIEDAYPDPAYSQIDAVFIQRETPEFKGLTTEMVAHLQKLKKQFNAEVEITSRDFKNKNWIISPVTDTQSTTYYIYNTETFKTDLLFTEQPALAKYKLQSMRPIKIKSRDGLILYSYLTEATPTNGKINSKALILYVHGGPWVRDVWGLSHEVQWLSNRGYNVLQVNFRGSSGFGKSFEFAGEREWGQKMLYDLIDAKNWAISNGYVDKAHVCILGASYGGYAVLSALAFAPAEFKCGISVSGVSDIKLFINEMPPYWQSFRSHWLRIYEFALTAIYG